MNTFIVRTTNIVELEKVAEIEYIAKFLDIVIINTNLSKVQIEQTDGVYKVELNDKFEAFSGR